MQSRISVLVWTLFSSVTMYGQSPTIQIWIYGDVAVTTSDSLTYTAVRVKGRMYRDSVRSGEHEVVFCITHAQPIASKLNYTGGGRVVYRAERTGKSTANGPRAEKMLPALGLGVLQTDGESRFFLAEGQSYPHPPSERSVGRVTTFKDVNVIRQDYLDRDGRQRGTDASSCFATEH